MRSQPLPGDASRRRAEEQFKTMGLGAFGQQGVERVLEILRNETRAGMQQMGAPSIKHLTPRMVQRA
jgi:hypothetical protein